MKWRRCKHALKRQLSFTPLDELLDALLEGRRRLITKEFTGFGNIRPSLGNIPRLLRLAVNDGLFANDSLYRLDHFRKRDGLVITEVNHFVVRALIMKRTEDAFDDVGDKGVVAAGGAVAKDRNWLTGFDQTDEFVDREIGTLPRAIDREKAEAEHTNAIEVAIHMA